MRLGAEGGGGGQRAGAKKEGASFKADGEGQV
jgi:hypothetical protein